MVSRLISNSTKLAHKNSDLSVGDAFDETTSVTSPLSVDNCNKKSIECVLMIRDKCANDSRICDMSRLKIRTEHFIFALHLPFIL